MAQLKAPTTIGGVAIDPTGPAVGEALVFDGLAFTPAPVAGGGGGSVPVGTMLMFAGAAAPTSYLICDGASLLRADYPELFTAIGTVFGAADGTHFNLPNFDGRVPIGVGTLAPDTYALGAVGGEARHVLTTAELATHAHTITHTHSLSAHTHGPGTLAMGNQSASHSHTGDSLLFPDSQSTGSTGHVHSGTGAETFARSINQASASGSGGAISGSTGNQSASHSHDINSGVTAGPSSDVTGGVSTPNTGNAGSNTAHENRQPYLGVNFIIRAVP
jgi:microcystin-dependent protein